MVYNMKKYHLHIKRIIMKLPFLFLICLSFMLAMGACLENSTEPEIIIDHGAYSYFYVDNQTGSDLKVSYKIAFLDMDSTVTVPTDTTFQVFQAGDMGLPPTPAEAIRKIAVYQLLENQSPLFLTIDPVTDADWIIVDEDLNDIDPESTNMYGEDGSAHYKLILSEGDTN